MEEKKLEQKINKMFEERLTKDNVTDHLRRTGEVKGYLYIGRDSTPWDIYAADMRAGDNVAGVYYKIGDQMIDIAKYAGIKWKP